MKRHQRKNFQSACSLDNAHLQSLELTARTKQNAICNYVCVPLVIRVKFWNVCKKKQNLHIYIYIYIYTGCNRRNGPDFGTVFLRSNYTDITLNTYIHSWTVTKILAREKSGLLWCLRTVLVSVTSFSLLLELHSYVRANVAPATLATVGAFSSELWLEVNGQLWHVCECFCSSI